MDMNAGDSLNSVELLKNTLHCDDKEKLRRKLAQLQKEYLKTAQRLQRAERLEAVQKHIKRKLQDQKEPEVTCSSSLTTNQNNSTVQDFDTLRRNQVLGFTLPSDAAGPQTPDLRDDAARGRRPSPTLRLRSRRSRLRLERRSTAEGGASNDSSQQGQGSGEGMGSVKPGEEQGMVESKADAVNESEELFSNTKSESPSLLLPHWNAQGHSETGNIFGKEHQRGHQEGKETDLDIAKPFLISEGRELLVTQAGDAEIKTGDDRSSCNELGKCFVEENRSESCEINEGGVIKSETNPKSSLETKEERNGMRREEKTDSLLDSCTLVEGLLFPAEYYIRTTRRMTVSQSQPDVQLILLSQLNNGRQRRSRGRGRGRNRHSHSGESSDQHTRTDFFSPETLSSFIDPLGSPHASAECGQSSSGVSDSITASQVDSESSFLPTVTTVRPLRGRRRGRGRGRGRPRTPRSHQHIREQTSADPQPSDIQVASSQSNGGVNTCFSSVEADPKPAGSTFLSNSHGAPTSCSAHHLEKVLPIFVKSSSSTSRPPQMNKGTPSWESLFLPSSSSPAQTSLLSPLSPFPVSLVSALKSLDIHQDFHLPDDQFASLKLHKLRRIAVESGVEHFSTPLRNTRSSIRRSHPECSMSDPSVMLPLPLSLTPTVLSSPRPDDAQLLHIRDLSVEQVLTNESISKSSVHELLGKNVAETDEEQQLCAETLDKSTKSVLAVGEETEGDAKEDRPSEDHTCGRDQSEHRDVADSVYSDYCPKETQEKPSNIRFPLESHKETKAPQESPASEKYLFITPHLPSPTPASSPALPSLGITPRLAAGGPPLSLPPPCSPSTTALSLPALSPFPSITSLSPSLPPLSPCRQIQDLSAPPAGSDQVIEPAAHPTPSSIQRHESDEQETNRSAEEHGMRCMHTLKAAAGGSLVDVCCFPGSSDGLFVAAAGAWAVCLWSWTPVSDWSLKHTWTFSKPVISVFTVQDAAELVCVTLGQLEIREVRLLLCSSLTQMLICDGVMQVVVGVYKSRVVTSSHAATGSTLQVFTPSDSVSSWSSQPLVSPGVCVGALAPVDGLPDALIGSDEGGHIFIWNLNSGQLLSRVLLSHGLSQASCLRGYAHCFLSSLNDEKEATIEEQRFLTEDTRTAMFSLVGINPLNGKSILATRLCPPEAWSGRLCEADVFHSSVVGLSQRGSACVWELGKRGTSRMLEAPEGEDWQLARWGGGGDMLVMGHHNGDVSVHQCW
ncbi:partner and localizer of BRCA2 isoform X2 [Nothobranchius furzeri]|uniref:partner and localizer of BRCA2 isoform X2 n=1 Tax=Nothobranchius furzeri TaxID=105023 RepID=UPI002404449D|nr:partner and localizer of BRCA2 isoform X2 [Nothobranchius furzeri]